MKNSFAVSELIPRHKDRSTTRLVERAGLVQLVPRRVYDIVESFYESTIRRIVDRPSAMKVMEAVADPSYSPRPSRLVGAVGRAPLEKKGRTFKHPLLVVIEGI